jgi:hypothetical protein
MKNLGKLLLLLALSLAPVACTDPEEDLVTPGGATSGGGNNTGLTGGVGNGGDTASGSTNP